MSGQYIIADLHLGHTNIIKFRDGFSTLEEHDQTLMDNIRSVYGKRNSIWLLGDTIFDERYQYFLEELCQNFQHVHNILGNHCTENKVREKMLKHMYGTQHNFHLHGMLSKFGFWLTHSPIHPDEIRKKIGNIHGHVHQNTIDDSRYFNVSVDNIDCKPITIDEIREIFNNR